MGRTKRNKGRRGLITASLLMVQMSVSVGIGEEMSGGLGHTDWSCGIGCEIFEVNQNQRKKYTFECT